MGLGMLLALLSLVASFSMDIAAHAKYNTTMCMFTYENSSSIVYDHNTGTTFPHDKNSSHTSDHPTLPTTLPLDSLFLIVQLTLSALSHVLIYTAAFEFICSQSPHAMKGLLICLLYAIKGLYQLLATLFVVPFVVGLLDSARPSCGFYYYLMNIVLGAIGTLVFVWVSKRYGYRDWSPTNILTNTNTAPAISEDNIPISLDIDAGAGNPDSVLVTSASGSGGKDIPTTTED